MADSVFQCNTKTCGKQKMPKISQVSFHTALKQSASLNVREGLSELRGICAVAGEWGKATDLQVT